MTFDGAHRARISTTVQSSVRSPTGRPGIDWCAKNSKPSENLTVRLSFPALSELIRGKGERLKTRDRAFIRALVHKDYLALRRDILTRQTCFLIVHPHVKFYTAFDYSQGAVTVDVFGVPTDGKGEDHHQPEWVARWEDQVRRVAMSDGRMELHTVAIRVGTRTHSLIVPLRSNSWELYDGVTQLAEMVVEEERRHPGCDASIIDDGVEELMKIAEASIH